MEFIADICLHDVPNIHNFRHDFSAEVIQQFAAQGFVVKMCYLHDNREDWTKAFITLKNVFDHASAIEYYSSVGFQLFVEKRNTYYPLRIGWGSGKVDLRTAVERLNERITEQAAIIKEQKKEIEELKEKLAMATKTTTSTQTEETGPPKHQEVMQIRGLENVPMVEYKAGSRLAEFFKSKGF